MSGAVEFVVHRQLVVGNVVINERTDRFEVNGTWIDLPVAGFFEVNDDGLITLWRDYFDMPTLMNQMQAAAELASGSRRCYLPALTAFVEAFGYAADLHRGDVRKGGDVPYLSHLMAVSALVLDHGGDETQAIAGLLHDAAEDHGGRERLADIDRRFGRPSPTSSRCAATAWWPTATRSRRGGPQGRVRRAVQQRCRTTRRR